MKTKAKALEKAINQSIHNVGSDFCERERFAIYEGDRIQVQVIVTQVKEDFMFELLPEYEKAET